MNVIYKSNLEEFILSTFLFIVNLIYKITHYHIFVETAVSLINFINKEIIMKIYLFRLIKMEIIKVLNYLKTFILKIYDNLNSVFLN